MQESARDGPRMHPDGPQGACSITVCAIWRLDGRGAPECTRMQESARDGPRMHQDGAQGTHSNAVCDIWRRDLGGCEGSP